MIIKEPQFAPDGIPTTTVMKRGGVSQPEDRHVTRAVRDLPFLSDGDWLNVRNDGNTTLTFRWARKPYVIPPGETVNVIFEALVDQLGDPRSMDNQMVRYNDGNGNSGIVLDRYQELSRLFARYGVQKESIPDLRDAAPKVHVTTMSGQTVWFPCQEPEMLPFPVSLVDERAARSDVTRMIDQQAAENAELRERLERLEEMYSSEIERRQGVDA